MQKMNNPSNRYAHTGRKYVLCVVLCVLSVLGLGLWYGPASLETAPWLTVQVAPFSLAAPCSSHVQCMDVYRCGGAHRSHITVYVYPYRRYRVVEGTGGNASHVGSVLGWSREFAAILKSIVDSRFYTEDPGKACLFIPSIDTLIHDPHSLLTRSALVSSPWWQDGQNHLMFRAASSTENADTSVGNAIMASSFHSVGNFRHDVDISVPSLENCDRRAGVPVSAAHSRVWLLVRFAESAENDPSVSSSDDRVLTVHSCFSNGSLCSPRSEPVSSVKLLTRVRFCLVAAWKDRCPTDLLMLAARAGCVPVVSPGCHSLLPQLLPFASVLDWSLFSVLLPTPMAEYRVLQIISDISERRERQLRDQLDWVYSQYFSSCRQVALTTLQIVNDRLLPHRRRSLAEWNGRGRQSVEHVSVPYTSPASGRCTAVILSFDRQRQLVQLIRQLAVVPFISRILVIWNNVASPPPSAGDWRDVEKSVRIIRSSENRLSNRFGVYPDIDTECVLSLDDDITMLTSNELHFAYQVWREYPDRLVGFPSRLHSCTPTNNSCSYDSEWGSSASMVLTGAAFYHKHWHYHYMKTLSYHLRDWIDSNFNCEDIAMNFLISNITGKAAIKVLPRKKFLCGGSVSSGDKECDSSAISGHTRYFVQRSQCVEYLKRYFGHVPLQTVHFRADPVLFREHYTDAVKRYPNVNSL